jgi:hypothetical protein
MVWDPVGYLWADLMLGNEVSVQTWRSPSETMNEYEDISPYLKDQTVRLCEIAKTRSQTPEVSSFS